MAELNRCNNIPYVRGILHLMSSFQEFYTVAINELILTTISGIVAVSIVAFLFIPHWTAVLFVSPLITTLYIDLLGKRPPCSWCD